MTELIFRPAEMADAPHIASLVDSAYRGESSRQGWTTEADFLDGRRTDVAEVQRLIAAQETLLLVCLRDNELVGSVLLERAADGAELGMFAIRPSLQGHGIGSRLLEQAEQTEFDTWHVERITLRVLTLRHELISFYQRRGYTRNGCFQSYTDNAQLWTPKVAGLRMELLEKSLPGSGQSINPAQR